MSTGGQTTTSTTKTDTQRSGGVKVSTKVESTGIVDRLELNPGYFRTIPGLLKIVQIVLSIICMICASPVVTSYTNFFMFVVAVYFVITAVLCVVYFFTLKALLPKWPWTVIELCVTGVAVVLYFIVSVVQLAATNRRDYHYALSHHHLYSGYMAAGSFGLFNFVAYAAGTFFLYLEWRQAKTVTTTPPTAGP